MMSNREQLSFSQCQLLDRSIPERLSRELVPGDLGTLLNQSGGASVNPVVRRCSIPHVGLLLKVVTAAGKARKPIPIRAAQVSCCQPGYSATGSIVQIIG